VTSGVYKKTAEHKRKLSEALKGNKNSLGYVPTEEKRKKISIANKGRVSWWKGKHLSDEHKKNLSISGEKRITSEETKKKLSKSKMGNKNSLGFHPTIETRKKLSKANSGKNNHFWQGGISFEPYPVKWTNSLKETIRERDNYKCQLCGIQQDELKGFSKKLDIHHIDYNKKNLNPNNLISLCRSCHQKTNYNRKYWTEYFKKGEKTCYRQRLVQFADGNLQTGNFKTASINVVEKY